MTKKRVLFIGDSITEWGRHEDPENLGVSYVRFLHDYFITNNPEEPVEVINKGVGGNRVCDLAERWHEDVLSISPDVLSISIGINDVWRRLDSPEMEQIYPEEFERIYTSLLEQVKQHSNASLVLMEPTIIEESIHSTGNELLKPYVKIVNNLAKNYGASLVPTHQVFLRYLEMNPGYNLTTDGVHMNSAGNMLMATSWLRAVMGRLTI